MSDPANSQEKSPQVESLTVSGSIDHDVRGDHVSVSVSGTIECDCGETVHVYSQQPVQCANGCGKRWRVEVQ